MSHDGPPGDTGHHEAHALSREQVQALGLASVGDEIRIHPTVQFFGPGRIHLGSHVRIDCFAIVTAGPGVVRVGSHVHIGAATHLFGTAGIVIDDYANLSSRVSVFSTNDDYTSGYLTNPTVPSRYTMVHGAEVRIAEHAIVGSGSVLLPGVVLHRGAAVGALSLVREPVHPFDVVAGTPASVIGTRDCDRLEALAAEMEQSRR